MCPWITNQDYCFFNNWSVLFEFIAMALLFGFVFGTVVGIVKKIKK